MRRSAVLGKACSILEGITGAARPLTRADPAGESRLPKPTIRRILKSRRDLGSLGIGKFANFILTDDELKVRGVWLSGERVDANR